MALKAVERDSFRSEVLESSDPVLVEFWAPWCPYCRRLMPVLERVSDKPEMGISVLTLNVDDMPELEDEYNVEIIPTLMLFRDGRHGERLINPPSQLSIEEWLLAQK